MENRIKYLSTISILPNEVLDKDIVFMSKAAVTESTRLRLKDINYKVLPDIWDNHKKLKEGSVYLEKLYGNLTKKIGFALSKLHNVDYPYSFWEIPMASWLLFFLPPLFDQYSRLRLAVELYGRENLTLFACQHKFGPYSGYPDFIEKLCVTEQSVSAFNGEVARHMGITVREFSSDKPPRRREPISGKRLDVLSMSFLLKVFNKLKKELWNLIVLKPFEGKNILMDQYVFNERERSVFAKELKAAFMPIMKKNCVKSENIDRLNLLSIKPHDEFEAIVIKLLPTFAPKYLLEEFRSYSQTAERYSNFKLYFFVNLWVSNIVFNYAVSLARLKGAKAVSCQHGGGYGQHENNYVESIERHFSDCFVSWGWKDFIYPGAQILPLPQPNLSRILNKHSPKLNIAIWGSTSFPKHVYRFYPYPFMPDMVPIYFSYKKSFVTTLDSDVRNFVVYRPYHYDYGWLEEEKNLLKEYNIRIKYSGTLPALLQKVKLYISDHLSTSCMEALVANTPSVFFWDYELCREREGAKPAFDLLRKAEILFHDPIDAANKVNSIWNDVQGWWMEPERQKARLKFMETFCWADSCWQERWIGAFKELVK